MKKSLVLVLLVGLCLLGPYSHAAITKTNVTGLQLDCDDPAAAATDTCLVVKDTSSSNTATIDGAGDVKLLETGGSTSDPDVEIDGYTVVDGTAELNGAVQVDGAVDFNSTVVAGNGYTVTNAQYGVILPYINTLQNRPGSGAPAGAVITSRSAINAEDCGTNGLGSAFVVCVSDGTDWRAVDGV